MVCQQQNLTKALSLSNQRIERQGKLSNKADVKVVEALMNKKASEKQKRGVYSW
jgi:hypothetical protein